MNVKTRESVRLQRLRQVWQQTAPSPEQIRSARRRYLACQNARPVKRDNLWLSFVTSAAAAAAVLFVYRGVMAPASHVADAPLQVAARAENGNSLELAGSGITDDQVGVAPTPGAVSVSEPPSAALTPDAVSAIATVEADGAALPLPANTPFEVASDQEVTVVFAGQRTVVRGPRLITLVRDPDQVSGFRMRLSAPVAKLTASARAAEGKERRSRAAAEIIVDRGAAKFPVLGKVPSSAAWTDAAEALRRGDSTRAEASLTDLSRASDAETRDAARLALAQLWLAERRSERAEPLLRELSARGSTPLVRRRATELLQELVTR